MTLVDKVEKLAQEVIEARWQRRGCTNYVEGRVFDVSTMVFWEFHDEIIAACREYSGILRTRANDVIQFTEPSVLPFISREDIRNEQRKQCKGLIDTWKGVLSGSLDDGGSLGKS